MTIKLKPEIESNILKTAEKLYNANGYKAVSFESIAEHAKISKRTLYKYYGSKEALIKSVLLARDMAFRESLNQFVGVFMNRNDKINAIMAWHINWFHSKDFNGCMFVKAQAEFSSTNEDISRINKAHKTWIEELIFSSLKTSEDNRITARAVMCMIEGMISDAMIHGGSSRDYSEEKNFVLKLIQDIPDSLS
ncbi:TPA: TetR/AcrR family transcriptional regulator [Providencia rettgeri]|nr:TetR/AcrR family transcriptional regulator [Providencia rettgeri]